MAGKKCVMLWPAAGRVADNTESGRPRTGYWDISLLSGSLQRYCLAPAVRTTS